MRLHAKLMLLIAAIAVALGAASYVVASRMLVASAERELEDRTTLLARFLADRLTDHVIDAEVVPVHELLDEAGAHEPYLAFAYVVGFDGRILAHTFDRGFPRALLPSGSKRLAGPRVTRYRTAQGPLIEVACPLIEGAQARVHVAVQRTQAYAQARRLKLWLVGVQGLLALCAAAVGMALTRRVTRPLEALAESMERFGAGGETGAFPYVGGGREVAELQGAFERMTADRVRAEEALSAEKDRLSVTLNSIGDGVIAADAAGRVAHLNPVAEQLTGWALAEAVGRPLPEVFRIVGEGDRRPLECPAEAVLRTGQASQLANHTLLLARDGAERFIADSASPIRGSGATVLGVVLVFRDVTQRRRADEELQRAEKLQSLGVLAGGIAHDFNNILTAILGNASLCRSLAPADGPLPARLLEIERAVERAGGLTGQLLTFARGGAPVRKAAGLGEIVEESAVFALRGAKARLRLELPAGLWPAEVDAGQISQVVHNLVLNADQAMPNGGEVLVSAENVVLSDGDHPTLPAGRYVRVSVIDQGVGIPAEHLGRIFDPYFTTKERGTGLGLASAYSIAVRHGGHLALASRPSEGTRADLYLPATQAVVAPPEATASPAPGAARGRLLVMDDDPLVRDTVLTVLEHLGYEAAAAADGAEAIEAYRTALAEGRRFSAVLLDLTVPGGMGGADAVRALRELDPGVRAIVSSGYSTDAVLAAPEQHGFRGMLTKPFQIERLAEELARVLAEP